MSISNDILFRWDSVVKASMARQRAIEEAMQICHDFQDSVNAILEWLPDAEQALDSLEPISDDYETISEQIQELLVRFYFHSIIFFAQILCFITSCMRLFYFVINTIMRSVWQFYDIMPITGSAKVLKITRRTV